MGDVIGDLGSELEARLDEMSAFRNLARRVSFDLDYRRTATPRTFREDGIVGDTIDNARDPLGQAITGKFTTNWDKLDAPVRTREEWLRLFLVAVLQEACHEALEWFQLDGFPVIDPHSNEFGPEVQKLADHLLDFVDVSALVEEGNAGTPALWGPGVD